jgi:hypothetical protein
MTPAQYCWVELISMPPASEPGRSVVTPTVVHVIDVIGGRAVGWVTCSWVDTLRPDV